VPLGEPAEPAPQALRRDVDPAAAAGSGPAQAGMSFIVRSARG
jgi:hypothetical protein